MQLKYIYSNILIWLTAISDYFTWTVLGSELSWIIDFLLVDSLFIRVPIYLRIHIFKQELKSTLCCIAVLYELRDSF